MRWLGQAAAAFALFFVSFTLPLKVARQLFSVCHQFRFAKPLTTSVELAIKVIPLRGEDQEP